MKVLFLGTPPFAVPTLRALLASGHPPAAVLTRRDRPAGRRADPLPSAVKREALAAGLPLLQPRRVNAPDTIQAVRDLAPDVAVVVAFGALLSPEFLSLPPRGCLNVHASLLPAYRGAAPIQWAVANGENETGVTIMQMDAGLDTGGILRQARTPIGPQESAEELAVRLAPLGAALLVETLDLLSRDALVPRPQPAEGVSHAPALRREDGRIDWDRPAVRIARLVRGMQPWPVAHALGPRGELQVFRAQAIDAGAEAPPGMVVGLRERRLVVACGEGTALGLAEVQPAGRRRMTAGDAWNGRFLRAGDRLR